MFKIKLQSFSSISKKGKKYFYCKDSRNSKIRCEAKIVMDNSGVDFFNNHSQECVHYQPIIFEQQPEVESNISEKTESTLCKTKASAEKVDFELQTPNKSQNIIPHISMTDSSSQCNCDCISTGDFSSQHDSNNAVSTHQDFSSQCYTSYYYQSPPCRERSYYVSKRPNHVESPCDGKLRMTIKQYQNYLEEVLNTGLKTSHNEILSLWSSDLLTKD